MFFGACEQPSTTLGVRPSGVLIMRKFWKPVDADRSTNGIYAFGPVPEPGRCRYQSNLASEPEILRNANGICAEVVRKQLQMSVRVCVCLSVCRVLFFVK